MRTYDEKLAPPAGLWVAVWVGAATLGLSVLSALGPWAGLIALLVPGLLLSALLLRSAAVVRVEDGVLRAGRAGIPVALLGPVQVLDAEAARAVRGPQSDPAAYHLIRGWVATGVRAEVRDPQDPTPYWFVATRRPADLAEAVDRAREGH